MRVLAATSLLLGLVAATADADVASPLSSSSLRRRLPPSCEAGCEGCNGQCSVCNQRCDPLPPTSEIDCCAVCPEVYGAGVCWAASSAPTRGPTGAPTSGPTSAPSAGPSQPPTSRAPSGGVPGTCDNVDRACDVDGDCVETVCVGGTEPGVPCDPGDGGACPAADGSCVGGSLAGASCADGAACTGTSTCVGGSADGETGCTSDAECPSKSTGPKDLREGRCDDGNGTCEGVGSPGTCTPSEGTCVFANPTSSPTKGPSTSPSKAPTSPPTNAPSPSPTSTPTEQPTTAPSRSPSSSPSRSPTGNPTESPTASPANTVNPACAYSGHYPLYCSEAEANAASPIQANEEVRFWDASLSALFMPIGATDSYHGDFDATSNNAPRCVCLPEPKGHPSYEPNPSLRKNVLFIAVDDLRMQLGHLEGTASPGSLDFASMVTPHIDNFAMNEAMRFNKAYVQYAICSVSRTSALTGRRPDTNLVYDLTTYWRDAGCPNCATLPQHFVQAGYSNVVGVGKVFHQGTSSNNNDMQYSWTAPYGTLGAGAHKDGTPLNSVTASEEQTQKLDDTMIVDDALQRLSEFAATPEEGPWFMAVGLKKPHLPFACPERFFDLYSQPDLPIADDDYVCPDDPVYPYPSDSHRSYELQSYDNAFVAELDDGSTMMLNSSEFWPGTKGCHWRIPEERTRSLTQAYKACVSHIDDELGRLWQGVKDEGFWSNTIIALWSDHGFKLGEHHAWAKHTSFNDDTHVPFFVRVPGAPGLTTQYDGPVEVVDLYSTIAEAAGLESIPSCSLDPSSSGSTSLCTEGRSLLPLLRGEAFPTKTATTQYLRNGRMGYSMVTGAERFTAWVDWQNDATTWTPQHAANGGNAFEWYDLTSDPKEKYNLAQDVNNAAVLSRFETLKGVFPQRVAAAPTAQPTTSPRPTPQAPPPGTIATVVHFNADAVSTKYTTTVAFPFDDDNPKTTNANQPVHGGFGAFASSDGRIWAVTTTADGGLKLRWSGNKGSTGEEMTGLFLWRQQDFLNGFHTGLVGMDSTTTTSFRTNSFDTARASASLRFVVKDDTGYHISQGFSMTPNSNLDVTPSNLSYHQFDPFTSPSSVEVGTIGDSSSPSFNSIEWAGFRMDAVRGSDTVNGVNIAVEELIINAKAQ